MSENTYDKEHSYTTYAPKVYKETFTNEAVAGDGTPLAHVALNATNGYSPLVPANPSLENLPMLHPERNDEEVRQDGSGLGVSEVYDLGWSDGAASRMSQCIFGLHIKDTIGKVLAAGISGNVAEIFTITCIASDGSNLNSTYFEFDGIDADGNKPVVKYYVWIDINNTGVDPDPDGRTAVEVDIAAGIVTDTAVALAVKNAIDALDDFSATVGAGDSDHIVTVENATEGAVDDAHDVDTGFTIAVTTDGVTTKTINESTTLPFIGFHNEKEKSSEDIRADIVGVTQLEYIWKCESGGKLEEERNYLTAWYVAGSDLARPRGPDGTQWLTQHPYSKYKKNFQWGDLTFTFKYNGTAIECKITSISIKAGIEVDYKRDDGSSYSNGREVKSRDYEITMTVRPTGTDLRDISLLHYSAYAGDITLTVKAQRGDDTNDYQQWAFTKLRLLPIPQDIIVEPYYEEFDIVLHAAPGNATTATVKGYLSQQYFGVD